MSDLGITSPPSALPTPQISLVWALIGLTLSLLLGAFSAANNAGVLVGASIRAKMITPRLAKILTALLYLVGAILLGPVLDQLSHNIIPEEAWKGSASRLAYAMVGSQISSIIMIVCSIFLLRLPLISGQIVIVGYLTAALAIGITPVTFYLGFLGVIWVAGPVLTVGLAFLSRKVVKRRIWSNDDPLCVLLKWLPLFFSAVTGIYTLAIMIWAIFGYWASASLKDSPNSHSLLITLGSSFASAFVVAILAYYFSLYFGVPAIKKWVFAQFQQAWQEYIPLEDDLRKAQRASQEQRGVFVDDVQDDRPGGRRFSNGSAGGLSGGLHKSRKTSGVVDTDASLSRIRAEEAFGYPQLFILSLLLILDGGILFAISNGPFLSIGVSSLIPSSPDLSKILWYGLSALSIPAGIIFISNSTFERFTPRFYLNLTAAESFNMELGSLFPALGGLIFGAPISITQSKLVSLFVWQLWECRGKDQSLSPSDRVVMRDCIIIWTGSWILGGGLSALLAFIFVKLFQ